MAELSFEIVSAEAARHSAAPMLVFTAAVRGAEGDQVRGVSLRCQVQIEPTRRPYTARERGALGDLFGEPEAWARSMHPLLMAHTGAIVPAFTGQCRAELPVACTYDLDVASARFLNALEGGEVPLIFLFSGTAHTADADGNEQVTPLGHDLEARFRLPASTWRSAMDRHFPNSAWLRVRRDVMDRLLAYRGRCALPTWECAFETLLSDQEAVP